ncbi:MAG: hypothetical protein SNG35_08560 [Rikenellaceae bacterium]
MNIFKDNLFLWFLLFLAVVAPSFFFGAVHLVALIIFAFVLLLIIGGIVIRWKLYSIQKSARAAQQAFYQQAEETAEGDVKVYKTEASNSKKVADNVGDYVEFEEVEQTNK